MIFISYSWHDASLVRPFVRKLKFIGFDTWIDYRDLDLSKDLASQLRKAVFASDAVLFFESRNACASPWVQYERLLTSINAKFCLSLPVSSTVSPNNSMLLMAISLTLHSASLRREGAAFLLSAENYVNYPPLNHI